MLDWLYSMSLLSRLVCLTLDRWLTVYWTGVGTIVLPKANNTVRSFSWSLIIYHVPPQCWSGISPLCAKNFLLGIDKMGFHRVASSFWLVTEKNQCFSRKSVGIVIARTELTNVSTCASHLAWASDFSWVISG